MTLQIDENVAPVEVRIHRCHYDAHCRARNYRDRGILTARHLDSMGRFLRLFETLRPAHGSCVWRITDFPRISNSPHTRAEHAVTPLAAQIVEIFGQRAARSTR